MLQLSLDTLNSAVQVPSVLTGTPHTSGSGPGSIAVRPGNGMDRRGGREIYAM
jgi:hypothetical protein